MVSTILMEWPDKTDRESIWLFADDNSEMDRISKVKYDDNIRKMHVLPLKIIHTFSCILLYTAKILPMYGMTYQQFLVETKNTVFMTYPMHNWAPYWLFKMVYACIPHFDLWWGHKQPCSFQLRIALNLRSTRHCVGIDLVSCVKSRTA